MLSPYGSGKHMSNMSHQRYIQQSIYLQ